MSKKINILINGITFDDANLVPLIKKISYWKKKKAFIVLIGSKYLANKIGKSLIDKLIYIGEKRPIGNKYSFIRYSILRNYQALTQISQIKDIDTVYSISSVLDLIILPFILKKTKKVKRWVTVLDNTVPLLSNGAIISGDFVVRILAWSFFKLSVILLKSADQIFVVKKELKTYLVKNGFSSNKIAVTGNGVEANLIIKARKRQKYSYDSLYLGRINEAKGIYDLLKVISLVKETRPNFKLAIVGNGDKTTVTKFKSKIRELGLVHNVKLLGFKTGQEKYDLIKSCKVFLFLSQTESLPVAPMEAVCSGKPVIVYKLDAYKMYRNKEVQAYNQGDVVSVSNKLIELLSEVNPTNKAGIKLLGKYSWDKIAEIEYRHLASK